MPLSCGVIMGDDKNLSVQVPRLCGVEMNEG